MDGATFFRLVGHRLRCDERRAEALTFAVFQELRDRLTPKEARDVAAQLPMRLKSLWREQDRPNRKVKRTHAHEFIGAVRMRAALPDDGEAGRAVKAVFAELQALLGSPHGIEGEAWDIFSQLPKDLKQLWLRCRETEGD